MKNQISYLFRIGTYLHNKGFAEKGRIYREFSYLKFLYLKGLQDNPEIPIENRFEFAYLILEYGIIPLETDNIIKS